MREILFRGKRTDNGEWIEGAYCKHDTVKICLSSDDPKTKHLIIADGFCDWGFEPPLNGYEVDPTTIGQYTGLKDKNGKRIFEADILWNGYICVVKYGKLNCACCDGVYGWHFDGGDIRLHELYEVIGNIHDNPELIGEDK